MICPWSYAVVVCLFLRLAGQRQSHRGVEHWKFYYRRSKCDMAIRYKRFLTPHLAAETAQQRPTADAHAAIEQLSHL